jgi:VWFA-related protein
MSRNFIRCSLFALIFVSACAVPVCAAGQSAAASNQAAATIHTNTDLVVVDVVATDARQNAVHHLTANNFTILEDGKPQTLKVFEEHSAAPTMQLPALPKLDPGTFTNYSPVPANGTLNILLFDKLNTPMNAQAVVRDQVLKFLKEIQPGTRVAIFTLTTRLSLLQGFTSNPELLRALVQGQKGNAGGSPLMTDQMRGDQPGADDPMMDAANDALGNDPDAATILADLQQFEAEQQAFQIQLRQRYTLDAMNQLARYMSMLPGRKNLIWFSGSFPINILPDPDLQNPCAIVASAEDEFKETVDLLTRSQVAVYPIDARGLMTAPMLDASQSGSTMARNPGNFAKANTKFFQNTADEHGTMNQMADATGGKSFVNTNGLKEAVEKAIETGSNYYTVAYTPTNRDWNGNYRKIQVKLDQPGVSLAYRRGYFANDPEKSAHRNQPGSTTPDPTRYSALRTAMLRGGPDPTELIFLANVRPATGDSEPSAAPGNQPVKKISGPFRRYNVSFITNPAEVNCPTTPDGVHHCALDFLTFVYDPDGTLINMQTDGVNANFSAADYASLLNRRLTFHQQISVPAKGEFYLRLGMRDRTTDNVGALELPIAVVAKLPAAPAPPPAANSAPAPAPAAPPSK